MTLENFLPRSDAAGQVACIMDALAGLDHLHRAGFCHRDIKAEHLLVTTDPAGPRTRWLDLEHAAAPGSLDSGAVYIAPPPQGLERGGDVFNPRDDVGSFCALLREVLPKVPTNPAVEVLHTFVQRAAQAYYLDELPHARAAWVVLRDAFEAAGLRVPVDCCALGHPGWTPNQAALEQWRTHLAEWERVRDSRCLRVHGPAGSGKRSFLARVAAMLAADGAQVTNLLGTRVAGQPWQCLRGTSPPVPGLIGDAGRIWLCEESVGAELVAAGVVQPGLPLLVVEVADTKAASGFGAGVPGLTSVDWSFTAFSARDWYRWIRASV